MRMYERIKESEKVVAFQRIARKKPSKKIEPVIEPVKEIVVGLSTENYNNLTKNQLVELLWSRGITHNKRQLKQELIDLLKENDKRNL